MRVCFFVLIAALLLTSCGSDDSNTANTDAPVRGIASVAGFALADATLEVRDGDGNLLFSETNATDAAGHFSFSLDNVPDAFSMATVGGTIDGVPFNGSLSAFIEQYDEEHSFYSLNQATSLHAETHRISGNADPEELETAVKACLNIHESIDLLTDFYFYSDAFDKNGFFETAGRGDGFDVYVASLAADVRDSLGQSAPSPSCPAPLPSGDLVLGAEESTAEFIVKELAKGVLGHVGGEMAGWALQSLSDHPAGTPLDEAVVQGFENLNDKLSRVNSNVVKLQKDVDILNKNILELMAEVEQSEYDSLFNIIREQTIYLKTLNNELFELSGRSDLGSVESIKRANEIYSDLSVLDLRKALATIQDHLTLKNGALGNLDNLIDFYGKSSLCDYDKFESMLAYYFQYEVMALNLLMEKAHMDNDMIAAQQHLDFYTGAASNSSAGMDVQIALLRPWVEKIMLCRDYEDEWSQPDGIKPSPTVLRMQNMNSQLLGNSGLEFEFWVRKRYINFAPAGESIVLEGAESGTTFDDTGLCWGAGTAICRNMTSDRLLTVDGPGATTSVGEYISSCGALAPTFMDHAAVLTSVSPTLAPGTYRLFNYMDYYTEEGEDPSPLGECYAGRQTYRYEYFSDRFKEHRITIPEGDYISNMIIYLYEDIYNVVDNY